MSGADWAPDGRIACAASGTILGRGGSFVLLMNADGSGARIVYQSPVSFVEPVVRLVLLTRWSPDASRLAVVEASTSVLDPAVGWSDILLMNADGGDVRRLTRSGPGEYAGAPSWAPDGTALAYHVAVMPSLFTMTIERSDVFAMRADGSGVVRLTDDGRSSQPAWRAGGFPPPATTTPTTPGSGATTTTTLPRPCATDADCDDADACTVDRCGDAGFCVWLPPGGFPGARCAVEDLSSSLCAPGAMDQAFSRSLRMRGKSALESLAAAEATARPARRARLLRTADRRLAAVARQAKKAARRKRRPMPADCADQVMRAVETAREAITPLRANGG
jgi:hypothetical protein